MRRALLFITLICISYTGKARPISYPNSPSAGITDSTHKKTAHPKVAMSDVVFNAVLNMVRRKRNDQEKIEVIKAGIKNNGITVNQLTQLLNQLSSDGTKLSCAEYAYQYTVNYKAYYDLENLLSNEDSKGDLEGFIKKNK